MSTKYLYNALIVKSEKNSYSRIIIGLSEVNQFFVNGKSDICSYVNNWGYSSKLFLRIRELIIFFIISLIENYIYIRKFIPETFFDITMIQGISKSLKGAFMDTIQHLIHS